MKIADRPVFERSLFSWVIHRNLKYQVILVLLIAVMVLARVLPLEMQKRIVNEAIRLKEIDLLFTYATIYLAAVVATGGLKYLTGTLQTIVGQRTVARMRKALYEHILTLPLRFFRRTQPGMVVSALVTELTAAGDFAGVAIAVPVTSLLTLLAFAGYLFWLNPLLAAVSLSIYPVVMLLVPWLQKRVNRINKKRVDATRDLASKIGEAVTGIHEIQGNGAFGIENRKLGRLVNRLLRIRIAWNLYRLAVKEINNFFNNLSPFLIFIIGGWLAIHGRLELGALVAFLSAQEKLYDPWKELIDYYQILQDTSVRYKRTMDYFTFLPEFPLLPDGRRPYDLDNTIEVQNLSFQADGGALLLNGITFSLAAGEHLALVGYSGSGKSTLAQCIVQLSRYTGGHVRVGGHEVGELSKLDIIANIGYVPQMPYIFEGSIKENLLYSCQAEAEGRDGLNARQPGLDAIIEVLQQTGIFVDVLRFGLNSVLPPDCDGEFVRTIIQARHRFRQHFGETLAGYVEFYHKERYLHFSSVLENLTFGSPNHPLYEAENLPHDGFFLHFLEEADLLRPLVSFGRELTVRTVDIFGNLPPDDVLFSECPLTPDELPEYQRLSASFKDKNLHELKEAERRMLLGLALRFTPGRHKMARLPAMLERLILEGRALFMDRIVQLDPRAFAFYTLSDYIHTQSILNNIFFGKPKTTNPKALARIDQNIIQLLIEEDILERVVEIGMQYEVGTKGDKLSGGQRQKIAIARAFLKAPKILVMDEATSGLDNASQARIQNLLETRLKLRPPTTLIAIVHRLDFIKNFDKIAVMRAGKIEEIGTYDELIQQKGILHELVFGKQ